MAFEQVRPDPHARNEGTHFHGTPQESALHLFTTLANVFPLFAH